MVARAINRVTGLEPQIKWVNDVYLGGRKVCGILTEASMEVSGGVPAFLILGIGINVEQAVFPEELRPIVTAISEHTDAELLAESLAERKLYGKNRIKKELFAKGFEADAIRDAMESLDVDFAEICAKRVKNMGGIAVFEEKETKSKAMASLMRYGFSYDDVREAVEFLKNEIF